MLATADGWIYEEKVDGWRIIGRETGRCRRRGWRVDDLVHGRRGAGGKRGASVIGGREWMSSGGQRRDTQRGAAVDQRHRAERSGTVSKGHRAGWHAGPRRHGGAQRHGLSNDGRVRRGRETGRRRRRGWSVDDLVHGRR